MDPAPGLDKILEDIGETGSLEPLSPHWEESAGPPGGGKPFFLERENLSSYCLFCGFGQELTESVLETAGAIAGNPGLAKLAWHCRHLLFRCPDYDSFSLWPPLEGVLGENRDIFYLVIALSAVPDTVEAHRRMRIPEEVTRQTCSQLRSISRNFEFGRGRPGIYKKQLFWLRHYTGGRLFRIGRMEYMLRPFGHGIAVFRERSSGAVKALAEGGTRISAGGYIDKPQEGGPAEGEWVSRYEETDEYAAGHLVSPEGFVTREYAVLPGKNWQAVLRGNMPVLEMHIPAGGGMTTEKCGESLRQAVAFFRRHFPLSPFSAVASSSWIFYGGLAGILPADSNIVLFQKELFLYPVPSTGTDGLWFIFHTEETSPEKLPRKTSLQRAVADFLAGGGEWRGGGMFFLTEHLAQFGNQYYRKTFSQMKKAE